MAAAPPSARSADRGCGEAADMASVMSRTWKAMASTQARAIWALPAPRVSPVMMPRASGSHHGLPEPGECGHEGDAAAVGHRLGQGPTSDASSMMPSPSRSHWMAAPETNVDLQARRPPAALPPA